MDIEPKIIEADSKEGKEIQRLSEKDILLSAVIEEDSTMPYVTASSSPGFGTVVPIKLGYETLYAMKRFLGQNNKIDTSIFVQEKLGYSSKLAVSNAFSAEQVDALALAIVQIESGKGFILGDKTGIGKGRVCAGICRYAAQNNKTPVFITAKATLFSDFYRDIIKIGGLTSKDEGLPVPFIFNCGAEAFVYDLTKKDTILFQPFTTKQTVALCEKQKVPKNTDIVLLTYSQLSGNPEDKSKQNTIAKLNFISAIASNSIFVLDESHKAAGDGNTGDNIASILSLSKGVMFASATYAKEPKSMLLYIPQTDIVDSNIRPKTIIDAVKRNGEVVQEYLAALLVKSGQMIRRDRTFVGCRIDYDYVNTHSKLEFYEKYDEILKSFIKLEEFVNSELYESARVKAIKRIARDNKIKVLQGEDAKRPAKKSKDREDWDRNHKRDFTATYSTAFAIRNKFNWIEELLFSLKADYVADQVIELLTKRTHIDVDGNEVPNNVTYRIGNKTWNEVTNYKPIIAVRNTSEATLSSLGYSPGDRITAEENDYGRTIDKLLLSINKANMTFTPIDEGKEKIVIEMAEIQPYDYEDNGVRYNTLKEELRGVVSGIPLSPIDHIINKIEAAKRPNWDKTYNDSENYVVDEVTKRSMCIKPDGSGFIVENRKPEATLVKIERFNSGISDVVILNTAGSTGISLHSSTDFIDKRPRTMVIHQVELDIAQETQKRGRINRTGQVNFPGYLYIVSPIPTEIRKLMMLRRKLRSLDANVTGNAIQSKESSIIKDALGNEIEDMSNKYGFIVLNEFLEEPGNEEFRVVIPKHWSNSLAADTDKFEQYLRALESKPCALQERFYDQMNARYSKYKADLIKRDEWELGGNVEMLNSSTINKKRLFAGNDKNEFTKSVYIEDKFITASGHPFTSEELKDKMDELSGGEKYHVFHQNLLKEYDTYIQETLINVQKAFGEPKIENAKTPEEIALIEEEHAQVVSNALELAATKLNDVRRNIEFFSVGKVVHIPNNPEDLDEGFLEKGGRRKEPPKSTGIVVGYVLLGKGTNKFSPMNIEVLLATPDKVIPRLKFSMTNRFFNLREWMKGASIMPYDTKVIAAWKVVLAVGRDKMRVLTGELFKALEMTEEMFNTDGNYQKRSRLIKYTTAQGGIESGVRLWQQKYIDLHRIESPVFAQINSAEYVKEIESNENRLYFLPTKKEYFRKHGNVYEFAICSGMGRNKNGTPKKLPALLSKYAQKDITDAIQAVTSVDFSIDQLDREMWFKGEWEIIWNLQFFVFTLTKEQFQKLLNWIFSRFAILVEINEGGEENFIIYNNTKDEGSEENEKQKDKEGVYEYSLLVPFSPEVPIPNYIEGSYKQTPKGYGIIAVRYPLDAIAAQSYSLVPANITEVQGVINILKSFTDDGERKAFVKDVTELGDDYIGIALLAEEKIAVDPKFCIGKVDYYRAGEIISKHILSPVEDKDNPSLIVEEVEDEIGVTSLDFNSAQDFLIQLASF